MTSGRSVYTRTYKLGLGLALVALGLILTPVISQAGRFQQNRAVGGISIDAAGVVQPAAVADQTNLVAQLRKQLKDAPEGLVVPAGMRMISLRGLEAALEASIRNNQGALPDELRYTTVSACFMILCELGLLVETSNVR